MTALDTNVLVRFLVRDDDAQARLAYNRLKQAEASRETLFVSLPVTLETIWVLESVYRYSRPQILSALEALLTMSVLDFENMAVLQSLIAQARSTSTDLSDLLIALHAKSCGCTHTLTFDKAAARHPLFQLLK